MLPELLEQDHRQQDEAGPALAITWNGAGAWLIFSQSRQVELLADILDHLPLTWDRFQRVSVTVSPSLRSRPPPQQSASGRSRHDHPLARQMFGEAACAPGACG